MDNNNTNHHPNKVGLRERTLSVKSSKALNTLDALRTTLTDYETECTELQEELKGSSNNNNNSQNILSIKNRLAQMNGEVEKLQNRGIDAVETFDLVSAKTEAKQERKELNQR